MAAETGQYQSTAQPEPIVEAILAALAPHSPTVETREPGRLVVGIGSVGMALLVGGFRGATKMPVRITVATNGGPSGTGLSVSVDARGTGGGATGGIMGVRKQKTANKHWLDLVAAAIPGRVS